MTKKYSIRNNQVELVQPAVKAQQSSGRRTTQYKQNKGAKKPQGRKRDAMPDNVVEELLREQQTETYHGKRDYLVFLLLWALGLRVNELSSFTYRHWADLCAKGSTLLYESKRNQSKEVVISTEDQSKLKSIPWVQEFWKVKGESVLLSDVKGRPVRKLYTIDYYNKKLKPYGEKYNLNLKTHSFRIGLVTKLLCKSDSNVVRDIVGHKDIRTTLRYNRGTTTTKRKREALDKIKEG